MKTDRINGNLVYAVSPDKTICALASSDDGSRIRCYDLHTALGSLRYTLVDREAPQDRSALQQSTMFRMEFVNSTAYLITAESSGIINIWDTQRAVLAHKLHLETQIKKADWTLLDVAAAPAGGPIFYVLCKMKDSGKCIMYEFNISSQGAKLKRKIKTGITLPVEQEHTPTAHCLATQAMQEERMLAAILLDGKIRILDLAKGSKFAKVSVPANAATVRFDSSGMYLLAASGEETSSNGMVFLYHTPEEDGKEKMFAMCNLNDFSTARHMEITIDPSDSTKGTLMVTSFEGAISLYELDLSVRGRSKKTNVAPLSGQVLENAAEESKDVKAICAMFHQSFPQLKITCVRSGALSSWTGMSTANILVDALTYRSEESLDMLKQIILKEPKQEDKASHSTKRKGAETNVMGAGDAIYGGTDGTVVTEAQPKKIKLSTQEEESEGESFWGVSEEEQATTLAERMAALSRQGAADEEYSDDDDVVQSARVAKDIQDDPDSLAVLLRQALQSSDEVKLDQALKCLDKPIVTKSVQALTNGEEAELDLVVALLLKLVHRVAQKPHRAMKLTSVWIQSILEVYSEALLEEAADPENPHATFSKQGSVVLSQILGPLTAMLKERVNAYPHLLKLDGRLNLMRLQHLVD